MKRERFQPKPRNFQEALRAYQEFGRYDFSDLPKPELLALFGHYRDHPLRFNKDAQTEIFEQFLLQGVFNEDELLVVFERMSGEQKKIVGEYIGKALAPGSYPKLFHDSWNFLEYDLHQEFIKKFTQDYPEGAIMVAPFVGLDQYVTEKSDEAHPHFFFRYRVHKDFPRTRKEGNTVSILEKYFSSFHDAKRLLRLCFRAEGEVEGLRAVFEHYKEKAPHFLYPYIPRLLRQGILTTDEAQKFFLEDNASSAHTDRYYLNASFYFTDEERARIDIVKKKAEKQDPNFSYNADEWPRNFVQEYDAIEDRARKRAVQHAFGTFSDYRHLLGGAQREFLQKHLYEGVPLFYVASSLGLSSGDIRLLLNNIREYGGSVIHLSDLSDLRELLKAGGEKIATEAVLLLFELEMSNMIPRLVRHVEDILPAFRPENQKKITKAITAYRPDIWLENLEYALSRGIVSFHDVLESMKGDPWKFFQNYWRMYYSLDRLQGIRLPGILKKEEFRDFGRELFGLYPSQVFRYGSLFHELYSPKEQTAFIASNIQNRDPSFLADALRALEESSEKKLPDVVAHLNDLRAMAREEPARFFDIVFNHHVSWVVVEKLLSGEERLNLLEKAIPNINLQDFQEYRLEGELLGDLLDHRSFLKRIFQELRRLDGVSILAKFAKGIQWVLHNDAMARKSSWQTPEYIRNDPEKYRLPDEKQAELQSVNKFLLGLLQAMCEKEPQLVFDREVLRLEELGVKDILEQEAPAYVTLHPESLQGLRAHLSPELFERLAQENIRALAFLQGRYGRLFLLKDLPESVAETIRTMNPLVHFEGVKQLKEDYYQSILGEIRSNPFYALFGHRLEAIAQKEFERLGPQTKPESFTPHEEFHPLVARLSLLALSPDVVAQKDTLMRLSKEEQEEILDFVETILLYGLDREPAKFQEALHHLEADPRRTKEQLVDLLLDRVAPIFQIEKPENTRTTIFRGDSLAALTRYFEACRPYRAMRVALQDTFRRLVRDDFFPWRSWGAAVPPHEDEKPALLRVLQTERLLPAKLNLLQYEAWLREERVSLEETLELSEDDLRHGIRRIFEEAIANHHIDGGEIVRDSVAARNAYEVVCLPISQWSERLSVLRHNITEAKKAGEKARPLSQEETNEYRALQKKIAEYREAHGTEIDRAEAFLYLSRLESLTMGELSKKMFEVGGKRVPFSKALRFIEDAFAEKPEFVQDIRRIHEMLLDAFTALFGEQPIGRTSLRISDPVDFNTYFKIGKFPVETCQSYDGNLEYNLGLLSYVIDPNVKIIQTHDSQGRFIARGILRLLEDDQGDPKLFLERIYSVNPHPKIRDAVRAFAKAKALHVGIGLYSHRLEGADDIIDEKKDLHSRGSRSPFVYSDAGGGRIRDGVYTIRGAFRIG